MGHLLTRTTSPGEPHGYHDIDTELDSATIGCLPHGLFHHHAFQPHLWRAGDPVVITDTDGRRHEGRAIEVSNHTGGVLIQLKYMPPDYRQDSMPATKIAL